MKNKTNLKQQNPKEAPQETQPTVKPNKTMAHYFP